MPEPTVASNGLVYKSNPKHTPGQEGNSLNAGVEPRDSIALFGVSILPSPGGKHRYPLDGKGGVHRFSFGNDGSWHWSGSTADKFNPIAKPIIPADVKRKFGLPGKWR